MVLNLEHPSGKCWDGSRCSEPSWRKMQDRMKPFGGIRRTMETKHSIGMEVVEGRKPTKIPAFLLLDGKVWKAAREFSFPASRFLWGLGNLPPLMWGISGCLPPPHLVEKPNFLIPRGSGMMSRERIWGPGPDPPPFTLHPRGFPTLKSLSVPLGSASG